MLCSQTNVQLGGLMIAAYARRARTVVKSNSVSGPMAGVAERRARIRPVKEGSSARGICSPRACRITRQPEAVREQIGADASHVRRRIAFVELFHVIECGASHRCTVRTGLFEHPTRRDELRDGHRRSDEQHARRHRGSNDSAWTVCRHEVQTARPLAAALAPSPIPQQTRRWEGGVSALNASAARGVLHVSTVEPPTVPPPVA